MPLRQETAQWRQRRMPAAPQQQGPSRAAPAACGARSAAVAVGPRRGAGARCAGAASGQKEWNRFWQSHGTGHTLAI